MLRGNSVMEEGGQFPERGGCGAHGTKGGDQGKEAMQCGMQNVSVTCSRVG